MGSSGGSGEIQWGTWWDPLGSGGISLGLVEFRGGLVGPVDPMEPGGIHGIWWDLVSATGSLVFILEPWFYKEAMTPFSL